MIFNSDNLNQLRGKELDGKCLPRLQLEIFDNVT